MALVDNADAEPLPLMYVRITPVCAVLYALAMGEKKT